MKTKTIILIISVVLVGIFTATLHPTTSQAAPTTDEVVGNGTPASCTEEEFDTQLTTVLASGSGTLTFNCGGAATINFTSGKVITGGTFTIDGGDQITLSGVNTWRHFYVVAEANLTLKNITLTNGYDNTYGGGAIITLGELTLENATVRDSNVDSSHSGGAIMGLDAPVTIIDSLIENNTGGSAGGLYLLGENADATITSSTFRNNRTTNASYGYGGAITPWNGADLTIQSSTLTQNQARYGGAIYNDHTNTTILIDGNSILNENVAEEDGGGLFNANGQVTMTDVSITGNASGSRGGGIHNNSSEIVELTHVTVSNNTANGDGGGIWNDRQSNIYNQVWTDLVIQNNTSDGNGGGIYTQNASLVMNTATISDNTSKDGGGIYFENGNLTLTDLTIHNNTANAIASDGGPIGVGGGIYMDGTINISNSTFNGNTATLLSGGIFLVPDGTLNVYRSTFNGNSAFTAGAIAAGVRTIVNLVNVTISQNSATFSGGLELWGSQSDLEYVTLFNNISFPGYGDFTFFGETLTIKNSILQSDTGINCEIGENNTITSAGFNMASDASCNLNGTGDQENVDAQLGSLQDNGGPTFTHLPRLGSPALDSGQCVVGISNDQRNIARPQGGICDKGSVERTPDDTDSFFIYLPITIQ